MTPSDLIPEGGERTIRVGSIVLSDDHPFGDLRVVSITNGVAELELAWVQSEQRHEANVLDLHQSELDPEFVK